MKSNNLTNLLLTLLLIWMMIFSFKMKSQLGKLIDLCTFPETEENLEVEDEPVVDLYLEMEC